MRKTLASLLATLLMLGCAGLSELGGPPTTEAERNEYAVAVETLPADPGTARKRLQAFVRRWPESPLADDAHMQLGDMALKRKDRKAALRHYEAVVTIHPDGKHSDTARLRVAQLEVKRGNHEPALAVMSQARLSRLSSDDRRAAYRVLANASDDPVAKLRWLSYLRGDEDEDEDGGDAIALIDVEIDLIVPQLDQSQLDAAAEQIGRRVPAARVRLRAAELAIDDGDLLRARTNLERAARLPLERQYEKRLATVRERLALEEEGTPNAAELPTFADLAGRRPSTARAVGTLGVVLPLSGRFAHFGEESLRGVLLAAEIFGQSSTQGERPAIRVLVRDSGGRPQRAAEAVRDLADDESVVAIIGPLLSGECEEAASAAQSEGVPLLTLTSREEIPRGRPYVFRVRTTPLQETQILVDHAMRELGAQRFAILYPRDAYGRGLRNLFWDAVEQRGGYVVAVAGYDPEATDFAGAIRRLVGYELLTEEEEAALKEREKMERRARRLPPEEAIVLREEAAAMTGVEGQPLPPIVDFDALFVPESHEKVVLIAPQLAFHEATGARLLGASGWHHQDLVSIAGKHVEGARFTTQFHAGSPVALVHAFAERYQAAFEKPADVLSAQAYDAANLVLVQLARGRNTREAVRDGVVAVRGYPGVTGVLSMRVDGNAGKRPFLLGIERGKIVEIE